MLKTSKKFNQRAFVACAMIFCGVGLPITGYANHVYAQEPITLQKHAWMSAHNSLSVLFMIFAIWHIVLNRKAIFSHLKNSAIKSHIFSHEAFFALALVGFVLIVFVGHAFH